MRHKIFCLFLLWIFTGFLIGPHVPVGEAQVPPITFTAGIPSSFFGRSLGAGDIDGDGITDIVVGAPGSLGEDPTGINPEPLPDGKAFIFLGPDFTGSIELVNPNPTAPNGYGWEVAAGNVGGATDAAYVSAPLNQPAPGTNFGTVYYYLDPINDPNPTFELNNPLPPTAPPFRFGNKLLFVPEPFMPSASTLVIIASGFLTPMVETTGFPWRASALDPAMPPPTSISVVCLEPNFGASLAEGFGGSILFGVPFANRHYASGLCEVLGVPQGRVHMAAVPGGQNAQWFQDDDNSFGISMATTISELGDLRTAVGAHLTNRVFVFDRNTATNNPFGGPGIHPITGEPNGAYGEPSQILEVTGAGFAGRSLRFADMNGDSIPDLIVGAPGGALGGQVIIYFGPAPYSDLSRIDLSEPGLGPGSGFCVEDFLGWSLVTGDFNGDGNLDIAAGRPCDGLEEEGSVTVFFGPFGA